jgi:hypothetical protein
MMDDFKWIEDVKINCVKVGDLFVTEGTRFLINRNQTLHLDGTLVDNGWGLFITIR